MIQERKEIIAAAKDRSHNLVKMKKDCEDGNINTEMMNSE